MWSLFWYVVLIVALLFMLSSHVVCLFLFYFCLGVGYLVGFCWWLGAWCFSFVFEASLIISLD